MPVTRIRRLSGWPDVLIPLAIWLVFTAIGSVILAVASSHQVALERSVPGYGVTEPIPASPGYFGVLTNWDANWYRSIAANGYPTALPLDANGVVQQNEWAFYPAYPMIVRAVLSLTGLDFAHGAWAVSLVFGAAAMVALFRLVRPRMGRFGAGAMVSCVMAYVTAPVLQVAYTEGLALLLVVVFIGAVSRRRLAAAVAVAVVLSLSRPIALPLGLVMATMVLRDWISSRHEPSRSRIPTGGLVATALVFATVGLWPLVAWVATGRRGAFFETQAAWPVNHNGLGGWLNDMVHLTPLGLVGIAIVLFVGLVGLRPGARLWGPELRVWAVLYPLYLILASRPSPSILRYLMLAIAPLWPFPAVGVSYLRNVRWAAPAILAVVMLMGLASQYVWVTTVFTVAHDPSQQPFP